MVSSIYSSKTSKLIHGGRSQASGHPGGRGEQLVTRMGPEGVFWGAGHGLPLDRCELSRCLYFVKFVEL